MNDLNSSPITGRLDPPAAHLEIAAESGPLPGQIMAREFDVTVAKAKTADTADAESMIGGSLIWYFLSRNRNARERLVMFHRFGLDGCGQRPSVLGVIGPHGEWS